MRRHLLLLLAVLYSTSYASFAQTDTLKVINWNIEWFGKGSGSKVKLQTQKVKFLMQEMNADVYALVEIVNLDSLESVVNSLGADYGWYASTYGSFAASPASPDYSGAQKLAIVYRKSKVRVLSRRPFLKSSTTAYYSFSSGRFPYLVDTEIKGNDGAWHPVTFIVLHAKAMSDDNSCNRRSNGAKELKDSLDVYYPDANFLLLGDFNDDLDVSICSGYPSNYQVFLNDTERYKALTLPLSEAGVSSIAGYPSFLDHVIASNEMAAYYVPGSATSLKSYVTSLVPDYVSRVSDHYPTKTSYVLQGGGNTTAVAGTEAPLSFTVYPVPAKASVTVAIAEAAQYQLMATNGQVLQSGRLQARHNHLSLAGLSPGLYWLMVWNEKGRNVRQLLVQ